jgi:Spy/CpxP family protein refolding chaperone
MSYKTVVLLVGALALIGFSPENASAQRRGARQGLQNPSRPNPPPFAPGFGHGHGFFLGRCVLESPEMNLSKEQWQSLDALRQEMKGAFMEHRGKMQELHSQLLDAISNPESTADTLRAIHAQIVQEREKMASEHFEMMLKARAILSPEQISKIKDIVPRCRAGGPPPQFAPDF